MLRRVGWSRIEVVSGREEEGRRGGGFEKGGRSCVVGREVGRRSRVVFFFD